MGQFRKLFQPGKIGSLETKNRIALASLAVSYMAQDGSVTDRQIAYYVARAKGGAGLILTEASYSRQKPYPGRLEVNDDKYIPGLARLAKAVHEAGAKVVLQINIGRGRNDIVECVSASGVPTPGSGVTPRALTVEEIQRYVAEYGEAARRARDAGFDGIEVHSIGGYLLADFLSPFTNLRTDEYGVTIEGKAKFALDAVKAARAKVGRDYPLLYKLMTVEHISAGLQLKDAILFAKLIEKAGADAIEVHTGTVAFSIEWAVSPMGVAHCHNALEAAAIKQNVKIPVLVSGRIVEPREADEVLQRGDADFVALGRALLADPDWPNKAMAGRSREIRRCIGCLRCLDDLLVRRSPTTCSVNPAVGEEASFKVVPADKRKKVLVIGGGPGGMEAARTAALRGHDVTLWEKSDALGGQLKVAVKPPHKGEIGTLTEYLVTQIGRLGVKVELEKEATVKSVKDFAPDAVIVATGASPKTLDIPGVNGGNVVAATDVLSGKVEVGQKVIILGGGMIGCETADFLVEKGRTVTVLKASDVLLDDMNQTIAKQLIARLEGANVRLMTRVEPREITAEGVIAASEGVTMHFAGDTVVLAKGMKSDNELSAALQGKVPELYSIGDSVEPRLIFNAIYEGAHIAAKI